MENLCWINCNKFARVLGHSFCIHDKITNIFILKDFIVHSMASFEEVTKILLKRSVRLNKIFAPSNYFGKKVSQNFKKLLLQIRAYWKDFCQKINQHAACLLGTPEYFEKDVKIIQLKHSPLSWILVLNVNFYDSLAGFERIWGCVKIPTIYIRGSPCMISDCTRKGD